MLSYLPLRTWPHNLGDVAIRIMFLNQMQQVLPKALADDQK